MVSPEIELFSPGRGSRRSGKGGVEGGGESLLQPVRATGSLIQ